MKHKTLEVFEGRRGADDHLRENVNLTTFYLHHGFVVTLIK